ncbi:MAG: hypothetical protein ABW250_08790 [Pyrinomonadaceae bacterium]
MHASPRRMTAALLLVSLAAQIFAAQTQKKSPPERSQPEVSQPAPACDAERALQLVSQQLVDSRALTNGAKRSAVLARGAEMLWPYDQPRARAVLAEAFDAASSHYRERGEAVERRAPRRADATYPGQPVVQPDPRMFVLLIIARLDHAWAEKLTARAAEEMRERALAGAPKERGQREAGERLAGMARSFASSDPALALSLARQALRFPSARFLGTFIYLLARTDRASADAFYVDALRTFADSDVASLLEISAYPFALNYNLGLRPGYNTVGPVPPDFKPSPELQRQFAAALLRASERSLKAAAGQPPPADDPQRASNPEIIYAALTALETLYGPTDKSFTALAEPLRQMAGGMLSGGGLRRATNNAENSTRTPGESAVKSDRIENVLAQADRMKEPDQHDRAIVTGLWGYLGDEPVERLEAVAEKIKDAAVRPQFLDSIYFSQVLRVLKAGRTDEAARAAEKVQSLEQRAVLAWELTAAEFKLTGAGVEARNVAESIYKSAQRAPESEEKARALLGLAYVYTKLDPQRTTALLAEAVSALNRLPGYDPFRPNVMRSVEGRTYYFYTFSPAPGFSLETVLKELAERDMDSALEVAGALDDRHARALAVFASVSKCLADSKPKPAPKRMPAAKKTDDAPKPQATPKKRP